MIDVNLDPVPIANVTIDIPEAQNMEVSWITQHAVEMRSRPFIRTLLILLSFLSFFPKENKSNVTITGSVSCLYYRSNLANLAKS